MDIQYTTFSRTTCMSNGSPVYTSKPGECIKLHDADHGIRVYPTAFHGQCKCETGGMDVFQYVQGCSGKSANAAHEASPGLKLAAVDASKADLIFQRYKCYHRPFPRVPSTECLVT
ncbi:hypothetical protein PSPO01_09599 [Paraphaeosphaeria sporulosa]